MRLISLGAMVWALSLSSTSVAAATPRLLEPTGTWNVNYAASECRLLRTFGVGDAAVTLRLARGGTIDTFDMVLAGASIPKLSQRLQITMKLEPQGETRSIEGYSLAVPKQPLRFIRWFDADAELLTISVAIRWPRFQPTEGSPSVST